MGIDRFFLGSGDYVVGGEGEDQFWVVNTELPDTPNRIADFQIDKDVIGFSGLDISFDDLTITQDGDNTIIAVQDRNVAILVNIDANNLTSDRFVFD